MKLKLKVFVLKGDRLVFKGEREPRWGDVILDGQETRMDSVSEVALTEGISDQVAEQILAGLPPEKREAFRTGLRSLGQVPPSEARGELRKLMTEYFLGQGLSEEEARRATETAIKGRVP